MNCGANIVASTMFGIGNPMNGIPILVGLVLLLPNLSSGCRRLHDIGKSGWWMLIAFTIIGIIPLIIWLASDTKPESHEYDIQV